MGKIRKDDKSTGSAGFGSVEGEQESVTRAGVSGGTIIITDGAAQQALTRKSAEEVLAGLDREVTSSTADASALLKAWDAARLQNDVDGQVKITAEFGKAATKQAGAYASRKAVEARSVDNEEEALKWDEGGEYRVAPHGGIGLLTGGLQGAIGAMASARLIPAIGEQIAGMNLPKAVSDALTIAVGAAIGEVAGGTAGAAAGFNETANNFISRSPFAKVRRTVSLENARLTNACGADCTQEDFKRIDQQMAKLEAAASWAAAAEMSSITQEGAKEFAQLVLELAPFYGTGEALVQLITGRSSITGEEASRFWAAVGLVPVIGAVGKELRKVAEPSVTALKDFVRGVPDSSVVKHADAPIAELPGLRAGNGEGLFSKSEIKAYDPPEGSLFGQANTASCVAASCRMAADLGDTPEAYIRDVLKTDDEGTFLSAIPSGLKELGFSGSADYYSNITRELIEGFTKSGGSVIVNVRTEVGKVHAVVVDSVKDGWAYIRDPWPLGVGSSYAVKMDELNSALVGTAVAIRP